MNKIIKPQSIIKKRQVNQTKLAPFSIEQLARKSVRNLTPYLSARRIGGSGDVWLNANESPFSHYQESECYLEGSKLNRYSDCQPLALLQAYADYAGVLIEQTLVSRGADEGIDLLIRAFCEPNNDAILFCPPTYGMYGVSAEMMGIARKTVPLNEDWQLDLPAIRHALTEKKRVVKVVFICNPNNPTGNLIKRADIISLLQMTHGQAIVVVDEAYIDFIAEASVVDLLAQYPHLVILRTLSKAFSLAGLRCGFTLANKPIIDLLLKVIAPYPIPIPVADIALKALSKEGIAYMQSHLSTLNNNRFYLQTALSAIEGLTIFEGKGNYLLVQFPDGDQLFKAAWDAGIILRNTNIDNCVRITIGDSEECQKVINFIIQFYAQSRSS